MNGARKSIATTETLSRVRMFKAKGPLAAALRAFGSAYNLPDNLSQRAQIVDGQRAHGAHDEPLIGKRGQGRLRAQLFIQPGLARYNPASRLNQSLGLLISKYGYAL